MKNERFKGYEGKKAGRLEGLKDIKFKGYEGKKVGRIGGSKVRKV